MIRTVLFGAGSQAKQVILNEKDERTFVAIIDNNNALHGQTYLSLPVIAPEELSDIEYDEIIVTTYRFEEVTHQLTSMLNVEQRKIVVPQKVHTRSLEVFRDENIRNQALSIISFLSNDKRLSHLDHYVDFDSLLALYQTSVLNREGAIVHVSISFDSLTELNDILPLVLADYSEANEYSIQSFTLTENCIIGLQLKIEADVVGARSFTILFRGRYLHDGHWIDLLSRGLYVVPNTLCEKAVLTDFGQHKVRVPALLEDYLTYLYDDAKNGSSSKPQINYQHRGIKCIDANAIKWPAKLAELFDSQSEKTSIVTAVYNHEDTLCDTLDSILQQLTAYSVHHYCFNDASTDKSGAILKRYQSRFPERITVFTSKKNQGSGKKNYLLHRPDIRGDYWCFLAGDDFFTDPFKIQKQSQYLLSVPEAVGCCSDSVMLEQSTGRETVIKTDYMKWNIYDLLMKRLTACHYVHTSSVLWRNIWKKKSGFFLPPDFVKSYASGDVILLHMMMMSGGEMHRLPGVMNCYRYTGRGVWSALSKEQQQASQDRVDAGVIKATPIRIKLLVSLLDMICEIKAVTKRLPGPLNERS